MKTNEIVRIKEQILPRIRKGDFITLGEMLGISQDNARMRFIRNKEDVVVALQALVLFREQLIERFKKCSCSTDISNISFDNYWSDYSLLSGFDSVVNQIADASAHKIKAHSLKRRYAEYEAINAYWFNVFLNLYPDPFLVIESSSQKVLKVNKALLKLYEYSRDEIEGSSVTLLSDEPESTSQALALVLRKGKYFVPRRVHKSKMGRKFEIEANLYAIPGSSLTPIFIEIRPITEKYQAKRGFRLRWDNEDMMFPFNLEFVGLAKLSRNYSWLWINDYLERLLGYDKKRFIGKNFLEFGHPDDFLSDKNLLEIIDNEDYQLFSFEKRFLRKDGRILWCKVLFSLIRDSNGRVSQVYVMIEDISLRRKLEQELIRRNRELKCVLQTSKLGYFVFHFDVNLLILSDIATEILEVNSIEVDCIEKFYSFFDKNTKAEIMHVVDAMKQGKIMDYSMDCFLGISLENRRRIRLNISRESEDKGDTLLFTFLDLTE